MQNNENFLQILFNRFVKIGIFCFIFFNNNGDEIVKYGTGLEAEIHLSFSGFFELNFQFALSYLKKNKSEFDIQ